jgi:protein-tyrosine phosphatase
VDKGAVFEEREGVDKGAVFEERDDEEYSETESARKLKKMRFYSKQCSQVLPHVCIAGEAIAKDRQALYDHQILRILNCAGTVLPCHHTADATLQYFKLPLNDAPEEQIGRYFYPVIEMLQEAEKEGQKALVHCHQGVSRSVTLVVAYIMCTQQRSYEQAFHSVREARGVGQPNVGFTCQLIEFEQRFNPIKRWGNNSARGNVYLGWPSELDQHDTFPGTPWLIKPACLVDHGLLQGKEVLAQDGCLIVHTREALLLYQGAHCSETVRAGAQKHIAHLRKYEQAPEPQTVDASSTQLRDTLQACGFALP